MIGIFDSGLGGLTVVRELHRQCPDAAFIYLGDTARTPYGNKSSETIIGYALEDADFLLSRGATTLVIACNSVSAVATDALRAAHPSVPVFEVITPAVETAVAYTKKRVGIIGTRATIASGVYGALLKDRGVAQILSQACPLFVPLIEEGWLEEPETKRIVRRYLTPLRQANVEALILGCTHYPMLTPLIQRYMGNGVRLIDSGAAVVHALLKSRDAHLFSGEQRYFFTDVSIHSHNIAKTWLGRDIRLEKAEIKT